MGINDDGLGPRVVEGEPAGGVGHGAAVAVENENERGRRGGRERRWQANEGFALQAGNYPGAMMGIGGGGRSGEPGENKDEDDQQGDYRQVAATKRNESRRRGRR